MTRTSGVLAATAATAIALSIAGCTADAPATTSAATAKSSAVQLTPGQPPPPGATGAPVAGTTSLPPIPVGTKADFGGGLTTTVLSVVPVKITASGPGDVSGPGVAVTVELSNQTSTAVDTSGIVVNAYDGKRVPASSSDGAPSAPFSGRLEPGKSGQGTYVFRTDDIPTLLVEIGYSGSSKVVLVRR